MITEIGGLGLGLVDVLNVTGSASVTGSEIIFDLIDGFVTSTDGLVQFLLTGQDRFISDSVIFSNRGVPDGFEFLVDRSRGELLVVAGSVPAPSVPVLLLIGLARLRYGRKKLKVA